MNSYKINGIEYKTDSIMEAIHRHALAMMTDATNAHLVNGVSPKTIAAKYGLKVEVLKPTVRVVAAYQELPNGDGPMPTPFDNVGGSIDGMKGLIMQARMGGVILPRAEAVDPVIQHDLDVQQGNKPKCGDISSDACVSYDGCSGCPADDDVDEDDEY